MIPTAYPSFLRLRLLSLVIALTLVLAACTSLPATPAALPPTAQPSQTSSPASLEASASPSPVKPATATPPPAATITPQAEAGQITCLAFSPDGRWLAVGTSLGVHLYDGQTFAPVQFIPTGKPVEQLAFSTDGQTLATNHSSAAQVQLWHVPDGAHRQTLEGYVSVLAFASRGDLLATGGDGIKLWRVSDGSLLQNLDTSGFVADLAFSPDGRSLASSGRIARLWSIPDGAVLRDLPAHCGDLGCRKIFYASGGQMLVTLSSQSLIEGWDAQDGSRKYGQAVDVYADGVAAAPNGPFIATSSMELGLWQVADGAFAQGLQKYTFSEALLAFAPNGNSLAASANGGVKVWDVARGTLQQALPGLFANGFAFSPDSAVLAVASAAKREVRVVRVADGTELARLDGRGQSFTASALAGPAASGPAAAGPAAASPAGLPAAPSPDTHWSTAFRLAGLDGMVRAMASDAAGNLYAAGDFLTADGVWVNHIARWDGTTWQALGGGLESVDALAADQQGKIYAATLLEGVRRVACWDGAAWKVLPGIFDNHISDLATDAQGNLYAAGWFSAVDTLLVHHVARWDGAAWAALGDGLENMVMDIILSPQGHLFASSGFAAAGGPSAYHVYEWDGSTWAALGDAFDSIIYSLALDDAGVLYAGGMFSSVDEAPARRVARWDGAAWRALGTGLGGSQVDGGASVEALAVDPQGRLLAGGYFTTADGARANHLARWDGHTWQEWGGGTNGTVFAIQVTPGGASYIGGEFTQSGDTSTRYLARWNETAGEAGAWQPVAARQDAGAGLDGNLQALVLDAQDHLYAGGEFLQAGRATVNHIARWDGTTWARLGNGLNGAVSSLALDDQGSLYASGEFTASGGQSLNHIARWDGAHWSALGKGLDGPARLAVSKDGSLVACWIEQDSSGKRTFHLARWDGAAWHAELPGDREECNYYGCQMLVDHQGNLYSGDIEAPVAKWDGAAWVTLGKEIFSGALMVDAQDHLVAVRQSAGPLFEGVFRWDGAAWQKVGDLFLNDSTGKDHSGLVSAILAGAQPGTLYLVASANRDQRGDEQRLFFWDGSTWKKLADLGSSQGIVSALALDSRGTLYLGGEFTALGGVPASHLAVWLAK